jgi:flavodoxin
MKCAIVVESRHKGNTKRLAEKMAEVLRADVFLSKEFDRRKFARYDLIGFGSGIYAGHHHRRIMKLVKSLPDGKKKVFVFSTSGEGTRRYHHKLKKILDEKKYKVLGDFACRGFVHMKLLWWEKRSNDGHPDKKDFMAARKFALGLKKKVR